MNRFRPPNVLRTASFRFAALYVTLFAASALVLGAAVFVISKNAVQRQVEARIETETEYLQREFQMGGLSHLIDLVTIRGRGASALDYLLQADRSHLAGEMPAISGLQPGWTVVDVLQATEDNGRPERDRALVTTIAPGLLLAVGSDLGQIGEVQEAIATAFFWTVGLAALLGIGGGVLLSRAFLARVDAISRTAEAIIGGELARRVPLRGTGDDLDRLAGTLNRMLDRISILMESLRQVSSDIAHDLRTPLTRLYQRLEGARAHARSIADYESEIDASIAETTGLLEVFSALLRIAQIEGNSASFGFRDVDLGAIVDAVADAYRPDAEDAGHNLVVDVVPAAIWGDPELLTQAVANLVENALKHTPPETEVRIRLSREPDWTILVVEDEGPGVGMDELPRLIDRFYRGEHSRTTPGSGLGLSLVNAVADLHAAKLVIESAAPGLRVKLSFATRLSRPSS